VSTTGQDAAGTAKPDGVEIGGLMRCYIAGLASEWRRLGEEEPQTQFQVAYRAAIRKCADELECVLPRGVGLDRARTPAAAFRADLADLREQVEAALDRSVDRCARCKVCDTQINAVMSAIGAEFDRVHAALEHAESAAAGSYEGMRLWMLDCGELVAEHRERAEAAEGKLAELRKRAEEWSALAPADDWGLTPADTVTADVGRAILAIIGTGEGGAVDDRSFMDPLL
jgi:hypothetical protein